MIKRPESLSAANVKSQGRTDEIVRGERSTADLHTATSRAHHDELREANTKNPSSDADHEQLAEERRRTDKATDLERSKMDKLILEERNSTSKLVTKFLERERTATDRHLLIERDTTDTQSIDSLNLLNEEVAKHKITQGTLTSRDEFLAIVSHDLRNPIGAVSAYADFILRGESDTKLGPETTQFIESIKRNANIALRLIADLLDVERISQNKLHLDISLCDVSDIAKAAFEIFTPLAVEKNITLAAKFLPGSMKLNCDEDRILQVISNLIGNALKYTPGNGRVDLIIKAEPNFVEFSVEDTGVGIPVEKHSEIFERLAQLNSGDRTGLGLGLYIAKTLVELHSGHLSVDSKLGRGSTFTFRLPKA